MKVFYANYMFFGPQCIYIQQFVTLALWNILLLKYSLSTTSRQPDLSYSHVRQLLKTFLLWLLDHSVVWTFHSLNCCWEMLLLICMKCTVYVYVWWILYHQCFHICIGCCRLEMLFRNGYWCCYSLDLLFHTRPSFITQNT